MRGGVSLIWFVEGGFAQRKRAAGVPVYVPLAQVQRSTTGGNQNAREIKFALPGLLFARWWSIGTGCGFVMVKGRTPAPLGFESADGGTGHA